MTPDNWTPENFNTVVLTIGSIVGAWFAWRGIKYQVDRARQRREVRPVVEEQDDAIVRYEDNPAKFVKDLFEDNQRLRATVNDLDEARQKDRDLVDQAIRDLRAIREELDNFKREDNRFRDALGRWLVRLLAAWGTTPAMPWPPPEDAAILHSVLPPRST